VTKTVKTQRWILNGQVQGVGFRPYIYRLATTFQLSGWIKNQLGEVEIVVQGHPHLLAAFAHALLPKAPPLAKPKIVSYQTVELPRLNGFQILSSDSNTEAMIHVPPDYAPCQDCLKELYDPADRRYRYPFINCTQCGPRFTIIKCLPYDRPNTSLSGFPLCPACQAEYTVPENRRFHAEPVACPECGPGLTFQQGDAWINNTEAALSACIQALQAGDIVAIKGIGGYHLMCDACHDKAVKRLRQLKPRPHKPLALLFPDDQSEDLSGLKPFVILEKYHIDWLRSAMRPIVMVNRVQNTPLSGEMAPDLAEVGMMLPCSPLHILLMDAFGGPLVATSANVSGEPILTSSTEVKKRLGHITQQFLHHNRPIVRPVDDPVFRFIQGMPRPLRLGRGCSPTELTLPFELSQPTLAVGGQQKNTVALAWRNRVVISAHIGDLASPRSQAVFEQVIRDLQQLYAVRAERIVCDAHPHYRSSRWAKLSGLPVHQVYHHHAHAAALVGEFYSSFQTPWLVFTWDGVGLGEDGTLWGGEAFYGYPGQWQRVGTLRSFAPLGGDKAARELWRSALAICWETGYHWNEGEKIFDSSLLYQAWQKRLNCPQTSAIGRLFDGAAALTGLLKNASYEGQGPMMLEAASQEVGEIIPLPIDKKQGIKEINWAPLIHKLLNTHDSVSSRAASFQASLADSLRTLACLIREEKGVTQIGLSGGVFQNRVLCERVFSLLHAENFKVFLGKQLPANDAALSFGQIIETMAMDFKNSSKNTAKINFR